MLREAAIMLGVSEGATRKRVARGTIRSEIGDGRRCVWLNSARLETNGGADGETELSAAAESGVLTSDRQELVVELRDRIDPLEQRLDEEREPRSRADTVIAQLTRPNASLTTKVPELEAPSEPPEPAETPEEEYARLVKRERTRQLQWDLTEAREQLEEERNKGFWRRLFKG
jgi:chromosome segregation ATPase